MSNSKTSEPQIVKREEHKRLHSGAIKFWTDGSNCFEVNPGKMDGQPFVVRADSEHWIPINVIVFADSEQDAIDRVKTALDEAAERNYKGDWKDPKEQVKKFKELEWVAQPYDKTVVSHVQWACNDGVLT
jgi:hypothetical protein